MLLRQTLLYLPAQVLGPLCQFIGIVLWTHWLGPKDLGLLALITVAQELAYVAAIGWFSLYTVRYATHLSTADKLDRYLKTESHLLVLVSCVLVPLTIALLAYLEDEQISVSLIVTTLAYAVSRTITQHLQDRARAMEAIVAYTSLHVAGPALGMGLALAAVTYIEATPAAILAGSAAGHLIGLILIRSMMLIGRWTGSGDKDILRMAFAYGWPLIIASPAIWLCGNALRYIIDYFEGIVAVGLITAGWGLGQRATSFAALLVAVASFPLAVRRTHENGITAGLAQLNRNGLLLVLVLAPATAGLILLREPLAALLVAETYREATAMVLPWAAAAGAIRSVRVHFTNQVFLLHERPRAAMLVDVADALLTVLGCGLGLWLGGLLGALIGGTAAAFAALMLSIVWGAARFQFHLNWPGLLRVGAATTLMTALASLANHGAPLTAVALTAAVGCLVYVAAVMALLPEGREILAALRQRR